MGRSPRSDDDAPTGRTFVGPITSRPRGLGRGPRAAVVALSLSAVLSATCGPEPPAAPSLAKVIGGDDAEPGCFVEPRAIAASPEGKIFVIDKTSQVQRFSSSGVYELSWQLPGENRRPGAPSGICVDRAGRVLVADTHESQVIAFDQDGGELFRLGTRGMGPGQFTLPTDVAVDSQGFIYVCEYGGNDRVSKFSPEGEYLFSFGDLASGIGALQRPSSLAIDESDNVWVTDSGNHRVCCFSPDGVLLRSLGTLGTEPGALRYPRDAVPLADGSLVVVDRGNNRLAFFDRRGRFLRCWGRPGRGDGELHLPENAAATDRRLFVADTKNHRVVSLPLESMSDDSGALASAAGVVPLEGG